MNEEIREMMLGEINEKLEELLALKRAFGELSKRTEELSKRTEKIEAMLSEFGSELDEEESERILERSLKTVELKRVMMLDKVESCQ